MFSGSLSTSTPFILIDLLDESYLQSFAPFTVALSGILYPVATLKRNVIESSIRIVDGLVDNADICANS